MRVASLAIVAISVGTAPARGRSQGPPGAASWTMKRHCLCLAGEQPGAAGLPEIAIFGPSIQNLDDLANHFTPHNQ